MPLHAPPLPLSDGLRLTYAPAFSAWTWEITWEAGLVEVRAFGPGDQASGGRASVAMGEVDMEAVAAWMARAEVLPDPDYRAYFRDGDSGVIEVWRGGACVHVSGSGACLDFEAIARRREGYNNSVHSALVRELLAATATLRGVVSRG